MFLAFRCTAMDIIATYCFARCDNSLDADDFHDPLLINIQRTISFFWVINLLPFLVPVVATLPQKLAARFDSRFLAFIKLRNMITAQIDVILNDRDFLENDNWTIYHRLLSGTHEDTQSFIPSRRDLCDEALSLLQAGSDTVGNTCTIGTFYVLNDQAIHSKLCKELQEVWPDRSAQLSYTTLEKLPYLTAVIKESLRMSHGIVTPLPRVVGPPGATIAGFNVPASVRSIPNQSPPDLALLTTIQTIVGVSATCLHDDDMIFPKPHLFSPERWMQPNSRRLETHLIPFSKGPRMCLGINLAWCELYLIFGNVFRKLDMEIYNTTVEDFRRFKEFFIPVYLGRQFHVLAKEKII